MDAETLTLEILHEKLFRFDPLCNWGDCETTAEALWPLIEAHTRAAVERERSACEAVARDVAREHLCNEKSIGAEDAADAIAARKGGAE